MTNINKAELIRKHPHDIAELISDLSQNEQTIAFVLLPSHLEGQVFSYLDRKTQENILKSLGSKEIASILSHMPPDDQAEIFSGFPDHLIKDAVSLLSDDERKTALMLIGYKEHEVGRMMTPYYIEVKRHWTVQQTLQYIKQYGKKAETLNFVYVVDDDQKLIDDIKIGTLLMAELETTISKLMDNEFICLKSTMKKDDAVVVFDKYDRAALPVMSESGVLVGIVTFDDILDQVEKRDTEDIQKFGGLEALDLPYVATPLFEMVKKRAGWLVILFLSEMLTATAMGYFENEIQKAVVLALFVP